MSDRQQQRTAPEARIVGIPLGGDVRKQFGDKLAPVQPEVHFDCSSQPLTLPRDSSRGIFIVHIPESSRRPHQLRSLGIFYRRGDGGQAVPMDYYEVRDQMLLTEERLRKMTLLRLKLIQYRRLTEKLQRIPRQEDRNRVFYRFEAAAFEMLIADTCSLLRTCPIIRG